MKFAKQFVVFNVMIFVCFLSGCGGGGGGGTTSDSGTVTLSVTDAKPLLPDDVENFFVEFSEVWVHKPSEGWIELPLVESPYTIDLLQFYDGFTAELVPPTKLSSGKYTQVRFVVSSAAMGVSDGHGRITERVVEIPSENLKTDKNFTIDLGPDAAIDLVAHFDLSQSVVVSGPASDPTYKLKPVLHLFDDPFTAAIIDGSISNAAFGASGKATIVVIAENNGEEYTSVEITKSTTADSTEYSIFWIVPNQEYTVQIFFDQDETPDCVKTIGDGGDFESPQPGEAVDIGTCSKPI